MIQRRPLVDKSLPSLVSIMSIVGSSPEVISRPVDKFSVGATQMLEETVDATAATARIA